MLAMPPGPPRPARPLCVPLAPGADAPSGEPHGCQRHSTKPRISSARTISAILRPRWLLTTPGGVSRLSVGRPGAPPGDFGEAGAAGREVSECCCCSSIGSVSDWLGSEAYARLCRIAAWRLLGDCRARAWRSHLRIA